MRRIAVFLMVMFFAGSGWALDKNLYDMFKDAHVIKVYLEDVKNESGSDEVKVDVFKKLLKEAFLERKKTTFDVVDTKSDADVIIVSKIRKFAFIKKAMPLMIGATSAIADTVEPKSSATLVVDYEVIRPSDGAVLISYKGFLTEARRKISRMEGENGYLLAAKRNANKFIYKAFYEQKEDKINEI